MTIAIACNLADGLILGVDSAVTISMQGQKAKIFAEGEKWAPLWNRPIACCYWGIGLLDNRTIRSYIREFETTHGNFDRPDATIEEIAKALHSFLNGKYLAALAKGGPVPPLDQRPPLGLFVGGFGGGEYLSEVWEVAAAWDDPAGGVARTMAPGVSGATWRGMTEGIIRLIFGAPTATLERAAEIALTHYSVVRDAVRDANLVPLLDAEVQRQGLPFQVWGMPLNEGIEFVRFLLSVQTNMSRFVLDKEGCGGRVRLIAVTKDGVEQVSRTPYTASEG